MTQLEINFNEKQKQKAKELIDKFYYSLPNNGYINEGVNSCESRWNEAVTCAIIAVDEIINTLNFDIRDLDVRGNILLDLIKFWRQVKDELEITKTIINKQWHNQLKNQK